MTNYLGENDSELFGTAEVKDLTIVDSLTMGDPTAYSVTLDPPPGDSYILKTSGGVLVWDLDAIGAGDVVGPVSSTAGEICSYSSATGKAITNSACFASGGRASIGTTLLPGVNFAVESDATDDCIVEIKTAATGKDAYLLFAHNLITKYTIKSEGGGSERLTFSGSAGVQRFALTSTGIIFGTTATGYTFPQIRGTTGQLLTTDGVGNVDWADPAVGSSLISPDTLTTFTVADANTILNKSGTNRISVDATATDFQSPGSLYICSLQDTIFRVSDATSTRCDISNTESFLLSPNKNNGLNISDGTITTSFASINRQLIDATATTHSSPATTYITTLQDAIFRVSDGVGPRCDISDTESFIVSPNKTSGINVADATVATSLSGVERMKVDATETLVKSPDELLSISLSDIEILATGRMYCTGPVEVENDLLCKGSLTTDDGVATNLGTTNAMTSRPTNMVMIANETIAVGELLKIVNVGGVARVTKILAADAASTPVFGTAFTAGVLGGNMVVSMGGVFSVSIRDTFNVFPGDLLIKSNTTDGRAVLGVPGPGVFAIALTSATGTPTGSGQCLCVFKKHEVF